VRPRALTLTLSRKRERGAAGRARGQGFASAKGTREAEEGPRGPCAVVVSGKRKRDAIGRLRGPAVLAAVWLLAPAAPSAASVTVSIQPLPLAGEVGAAAPGEGATPPPPAAFAGALDDDTDVVLFPAARRPTSRPVVTVATRVRGTPSAVGAVLLDPNRYRAALPSLVRADVVATRAGSLPSVGPDRLLAWELEIPLFNLKGKAWLTRQADVIELTLVEGAFAPGHVRFRMAPADGGRATILVSEAQLEPRSANWIFRRVAGHDPWSETAMTAAAAMVLARAVALEVAVPHQAGRGPARPEGPMTAPAAATLDGSTLAGPTFRGLRKAGVVATIHRTRRGRLAHVSAAVSIAGNPTEVAARVDAPESWTAFPGWKSVTRLAPPQRQDELKITVEDDVAFVDLDATWDVKYGPSAGATVIAGATKGAVLQWQVFPAPPSGLPGQAALAVLSEQPRLDESGYVARKMIESEPLMEHALALALTYADVAAMADRIDPGRASSK